MKSRCIYAAFLILFLLSALPRPSASEPINRLYVEDFSTTTYKDPVNTTAWWDTVAAEIKMYPFDVTLVGTYDTPGVSRDVVIAGNYAYVVDDANGLVVVDVLDPETPGFAGGFDTPGVAYGIAIAGDYAYVADDLSGLTVVDISDPTMPGFAGSYDTPGAARGVAIAGDYAYVADHDSGLVVVDITDPTIPTLAGRYATSGAAHAVAIAGDLAFVAAGGAGLEVVDITDPTNPAFVGSYDTADDAYGVAVDGDYAYVADDASGLLVIEIYDPATPTLAGSYDSPGSARDVSVDGSYAYVADGDAGLLVIDVNDRAHPSLVDSYDTPGEAHGVAFDGIHAFVGDGESGLQVIVVRESVEPFQESYLILGGDPSGVAVAGEFAFVAAGDAGLVVVEILDPANPYVVAEFETPGDAKDVFISGDHAYVADGGHFTVVDISDPGAPTLAGTTTQGRGVDVVVAGDYAYLASGGEVDGTLYVMDVSDPTNPTLAGSYEIANGPVNGVAIAGDYAFLAAGPAGLEVLDIRDPTNPVYAGGGVLMDDDFRAIALSGNYAYVVGQLMLGFGELLLVFDISDPTLPEITFGMAPLYTSRAKDIVVAGDRAYVVSAFDEYPEDGGFQVFDISDPSTTPLYVHHTYHYVTIEAVGIAGDHVYLVEQESLSRLCIDKVYDRSLVPDLNTGQSLPIAHDVAAVRLTSSHTDSVLWEVSAMNGYLWCRVSPDGSWMPVEYPGDEAGNLLWRSTHSVIPGSGNPACTHLEIEWLHNFAVIDSIVDVPEDQGGWVRIHITRSGRDFAGWDGPPQYAIWRWVDEGALPSAMLIGWPDDCPTPSDEARLTDGFPPGTWEIVGSFPGLCQQQYIYLAPTVVDSSSAGSSHATYLVTAHLSHTFFVSPPDSSYSVDNIPPSPPEGLDFDPPPEILVWDVAPENDFAYYTVYGSDNEEFDSTAALIAYTIVPRQDVSGTQVPFYHVTTSDFAGNASEAATIAHPLVVDDPDAIPTDFALLAGRPNPFRSGSVVTLDLPRKEAVRLAVYDVAGRRVRELARGDYQAGRYVIQWDGTDQTGQRVGTGVYFVRVVAGPFRAWRQLIRIE